ncbi:MAG: altronate dehydratase family protein [Lachnospiraceae bacterium]|nr:altronate dehydratase family protein [Lachnospiraceae bacterium]
MDAVIINPLDNVAVALRDMKRGEKTDIGGSCVTLTDDVARGHKIAIKDIEAGGPVIKYGTRIGIATSPVKCGSHVHTHNTRTALSGEGDYKYEPSVNELPVLPKRTFMGYKRPDGKTGIRNEIWIIPTVGCVNSVAQRLAAGNQDLVRGSVDGLYCFTHPYGCSQLSDDLAATKKILTSLVRHPNAGGVLVLSLGCENLTMEMFKEELKEWDEDRVKFLVCQNLDDELAEGRQLLMELSEYAGTFKRTERDAGELVIGLKCGGSDGLSGITANPVAGRITDMITSMGGSAVLTEVPEMFGAEEMLLNRCADREIFDKAVGMINDFKKYFIDHGQVVYENPSPGNKAGGITTLEDKSCGCVQKGGRAVVTDVLKYGEAVRSRGLTLLSGPGNDIVSTTALAAAGVHMILFTTGRGTPLGTPVPTIRISSNSDLYARKEKWIDINAGAIADGTKTGDEVAHMLFEQVMLTASGKCTRQELNGYRDIAIFKDGVTL